MGDGAKKKFEMKCGEIKIFFNTWFIYWSWFLTELVLLNAFILDFFQSTVNLKAWQILPFQV